MMHHLGLGLFLQRLTIDIWHDYTKKKKNESPSDLYTIRLSCSSFRMSLADYFVKGLEVHPHMGDFGAVIDIEGVDELQHQFHHLQLGDETFGGPVSVMIAPSSPDQANFLSLCFLEETIDCGVDVEPTRVIDGVVPHNEYWDDMDMTSMSQITKRVQLKSASPFDLFEVFVIEVAEEIQTVLAPELMEDVSVGDDLFEDTFSSIEGEFYFVNPPL